MGLHLSFNLFVVVAIQDDFLILIHEKLNNEATVQKPMQFKLGTRRIDKPALLLVRYHIGEYTFGHLLQLYLLRMLYQILGNFQCVDILCVLA